MHTLPYNRLASGWTHEALRHCNAVLRWEKQIGMSTERKQQSHFSLILVSGEVNITDTATLMLFQHKKMSLAICSYKSIFSHYTTFYTKDT
jgi:hypothetical protein